ncbi:alpha-galactosidase [Maribacter polysiphoniae]|uniref:alpha-galactosidase n=1 Tax=Maribacter polysiphoniae TaxID=429344 RepID=UPI002357AB44|nr:alpha-galactosidase [Maribacter polysiphoniae]
MELKKSNLRVLLYLVFIIALQSCADQDQSVITYSFENEIHHFNNQEILLEIDNKMKIIPSYKTKNTILSVVVDDSLPNDYLFIEGNPISDFNVTKKELTEVKTEFGTGKRLKLYGEYKGLVNHKSLAIQKVLTIELYEDFPNSVITYVAYTNSSKTPITINKLVETQYTLNRKLVNPSKKNYDFALFQGCGVDWGLDYAHIEMTPTYAATNFMGVEVASRDPSGGGIPLLDLWGKEMGMSIAHISKKPEFVSMPIKTLKNGNIQYAIEEAHSAQNGTIVLASEDTYTTIKNAVTVHNLDYFDALRRYAEFLNAQGIKTFKKTPNDVPDTYWKTWGYELDFKVKDIYAKVPEFKELGIEMVVLDDGWFSNYGDWEPSTDKHKFPEGRKDLIAFVNNMHKEDLKVGVWWCPLSVEPDTEVAKANPDWLMLQKNGEPYIMEEPTSYYLCPDYQPVLEFWEQQVEKIYVTFDLDFIYNDWANLIEVPPCYNPKHKHKSPLSPYWNMPEQFKIIYDKAQSIKPGCAVEMCECGRPHDPYKMPFYNITNASDATSKKQVREKLKVEKALNGSSVYFNPGYILPHREEGWNYDPCEIDECVAMGGYFETYYTEISPEKKEEWKKWLKIYREEEIYKGEYLNLYDIANDYPEFHVTKKENTLYYFAPGPFKGKVTLRGLKGSTTYTIKDLGTDKTIATIDGSVANVNISTENDIYLKVTPLTK